MEDKLMEDKSVVINCIYKDYKRNRGSIDSAKSFVSYIKEILCSHYPLVKYYNKLDIKYSFKHTFSGLNPEAIYYSGYTLSELAKRFKNNKNLLKKSKINIEVLLKEVSQINTKEEILFNFCMAQTPSQRGLYSIIQKENDIIFGKGEGSHEYLQTFYSSFILDAKFFPKYFLKFDNEILKYRDKNNRFLLKRILKKRFSNALFNFEKASKLGEKIPLVIGWYDRNDTSPLQTKKYQEFISRLSSFEDFEKFQVEIIKFGSSEDNFYKLSMVDIMLYAEPDHFDPFPNMIFQLIYYGAFILDIDNNYSNQTRIDYNLPKGINELFELFPDRFISGQIFKDYYNYIKKISKIKNGLEKTSVINKEIEKIFLPTEMLVEYTKIRIFLKLEEEVNNYVIKNNLLPVKKYKTKEKIK